MAEMVVLLATSSIFKRLYFCVLCVLCCVYLRGAIGHRELSKVNYFWRKRQIKNAGCKDHDYGHKKM